jgi:hypothetical protein
MVHMQLDFLSVPKFHASQMKPNILLYDLFLVLGYGGS